MQAYNKLPDNRKDTYCLIVFFDIQLENLHFLYTFLAAFFIPVNYTSLINKKEG